MTLPKLAPSWSDEVVLVPLADILSGESCDGIIWTRQPADWESRPSRAGWTGPKTEQYKRAEYGRECWDRFLAELSEEGIRRPVMWDPQWPLLGNGHHRVTAAMDLGWSHVPVVLWDSRAYGLGGDAWKRSTD